MLMAFNGNGKYISPEFVWKYGIAGSTEGRLNWDKKTILPTIIKQVKSNKLKIAK
jgi:hypothetical protein